MLITIEAQLLITIGGIVAGSLATYYAAIYGVKIALAEFKAKTEARLDSHDRDIADHDERIRYVERFPNIAKR
jgi:folate-dependent tRNA-U54 methylase TrmFO/GidA